MTNIPPQFIKYGQGCVAGQVRHKTNLQDDPSASTREVAAWHKWEEYVYLTRPSLFC